MSDSAPRTETDNTSSNSEQSSRSTTKMFVTIVGAVEAILVALAVQVDGVNRSILLYVSLAILIASASLACWLVYKDFLLKVSNTEKNEPKTRRRKKNRSQISDLGYSVGSQFLRISLVFLATLAAFSLDLLAITPDFPYNKKTAGIILSLPLYAYFSLFQLVLAKLKRLLGAC